MARNPPNEFINEFRNFLKSVNASDAMDIKVKAYPHGKFKDYAVMHFKLGTVVEILRANESYFRGHKPMSFAAFCYWIILPDEAQIRRNALIRFALGYLEFVEKQTRSSYKKQPRLISECLTRVIILREFMRRIFYPLTQNCRPFSWPTEELIKIFNKELNGLPEALQVISIIHFHHVNLQSPQYKKIGLTAAYDSVQQINAERANKIRKGSGFHAEENRKRIPGNVRKREVLARFNKFKTTIAFLYAAANFKWKETDLSFLDQIKNCQLPPFDVVRFKEFLELVVYVEVMLSRLREQKIGNQLKKALQDEVVPRVFDPPTFEQFEKEIIKKCFSART